MSTAYSGQTIAIIIVTAGVGTYLLRISMLIAIDHVPASSDRFSEPLRFVPPAVLAVLAVTLIIQFTAIPTPRLLYEPTELIAATAGATTAWLTRNVIATIAVGMLALWTLQLLI